MNEHNWWLFNEERYERELVKADAEYVCRKEQSEERAHKLESYLEELRSVFNEEY